MLSMFENTFFKNLQNVILDFEGEKELQNSSYWNNRDL